MEPTPLVYPLSVIVPFEPLDPSLADQVRWRVMALTGADEMVSSIASAIRIAMPRRRVGRTGRMGLPPLAYGPGRRLVPGAEGSHGEGTATRGAKRFPVTEGTDPASPHEGPAGRPTDGVH